jgi:hypothetical protein
VAPAAKPPCKPITREEEAYKVRESISAQGYTVVLEEAQHGAHGTLMTMDDIVVKRGTKITVYLLSSVVPKLLTRSAAIVTPIEEYDIKQFEKQAPGISIGHCTAPFTHSKPIPVTVLNMSNEDVTIKKGTTLATIVEADHELESSNTQTRESEVILGKSESAQMIEDKQLLKQLNDMLQQIEAIIKAQEAKRLASTTGSKTMLTLEEQELRSMFKSFIDGNTKESRGVNASTAHSD